MKSGDKRVIAELLIASVEAAIARGCRHYSESGELLATTLARFSSAAARGLRDRRGSGDPLKLARLALERVPSVSFHQLPYPERTQHSGLGGIITRAGAAGVFGRLRPLLPRHLTFPKPSRSIFRGSVGS